MGMDMADTSILAGRWRWLLLVLALAATGLVPALDPPSDDGSCPACRFPD